MGQKIKDVNKGVIVRITPQNSRKVVRVTKKTHRTFGAEVNVAVEEQMDKQIHSYKDDGK